ncbi:MAG: DUF4382 domain-containing protein [Thermoplasmatales archaeon]|nr:DUF4382 domain-containing protein [Thermoplasmatales archaeon]
MKRKCVGLILGVALLVGVMSGCIETPKEEAKVSLTEIRIGDMPTDEFKHINVTFSEVKLHKSGNDSGWVNFSMEPVTVDLIYLHINNLTEQLVEKEIDIDNYTKLWITVDNATGVLNETGETVYFDVPSKMLKIQHLFKLEEGNNAITVDIDLNDSILNYGGGEKYKLLPVIGSVEHHHKDMLQFREHNRSKIRNMVENRKPAIDIVVNGSRGKHVNVNVNETIMFNASGTYDVDGDVMTFIWDLDDGTNGTGRIVTHNYTEKGTYHVLLTVSDGELEDTTTITVTAKQKSDQDNGPG